MELAVLSLFCGGAGLFVHAADANRLNAANESKKGAAEILFMAECSLLCSAQQMKVNGYNVYMIRPWFSIVTRIATKFCSPNANGTLAQIDLWFCVIMSVSPRTEEAVECGLKIPIICRTL